MSRKLPSLFIASAVLVIVTLILHVFGLTGHLRLTPLILALLMLAVIGVFLLTERALRTNGGRRRSIIPMLKVIWRWTPRTALVALVALLVYANWRWFTTMPLAFIDGGESGSTEETAYPESKNERMKRAMLESDAVPAIMMFFASLSCTACYGGIRRDASGEEREVRGEE